MFDEAIKDEFCFEMQVEGKYEVLDFLVVFEDTSWDVGYVQMKPLRVTSKTYHNLPISFW